VLRHLPPIVDPKVLVGTSTSDDAGVYALAPDLGLVATVDFFTPIVDDPRAFGSIAAANALSDIYAMGGRPLFALNVAGFPRETLPLEILGEIIAGAAAKAAEAGIPIIGGHTIDDPEPKFGLVVIGRVAPTQVVRNVGARPGDRLFLTKQLGSGIVATAIKRGLASADLIERVTQVMSTLNRAAAEAMGLVSPHAATDITGFGLLGHLWEVASGSGVGARVDAGWVPVIPEVWDLARRGVIPGGTRRNMATLTNRVRWGNGTTDLDQIVLSDAQTSGGLLIAVSPEQAKTLREALEERGCVAAEIGEIVEGDRIIVERSS
jgi:selenide,water dikinase